MDGFGAATLPLVTLLLLSGSAAAPADDVAWPKDLGAPYVARVSNITSALGVEVDYWYAEPDSALSGLLDVLEHATQRPLRIVSDHSDGTLKVTIVRQDGTSDGFSVNVTRTVEEWGGGHRIRCVDGPCEPRMATVDRVRPEDLPLGIHFGIHNVVSILGPPAAFDGFGRGFDAARLMADALGIPTDLVDWTSPKDHSFRSFGHLTPEVEAIACVCAYRSWVVRDDVRGTGLVEALLASGRLIGFAASPLLPPGYMPPIPHDEATWLVSRHLAAAGFDRVIDREEGVGPGQIDLGLTLLEDHGVTWRFYTHAQGPRGSVMAEGFLDATSGEVVHEVRHPTLRGGYEHPPQAPPLWNVLLVVAIALVLVGRYERRP